MLPHHPVVVMPPRLARLLRAGEVVGNPASAVKELVENSIDAGATQVSVILEGGGIERIVVEDDGWGMTEDDLRLCLLPHASSKCSSEEDIESPRWLGFRGEALAALACSSAQVDVRSRRAGSDGWHVACSGGVITDPTPASGVPGTVVDVRSLHSDAPARRAMLKGAVREATLVRRMLEHLSLAHPDIGIRLQSGNRQLLCLPPSTLGQRLDTLGAAGGLDIDVSQGGWTIRGRIFPGSLRIDNRWIVAGRVVQRDASISAALRSVGRRLLGGGGTPSFQGIVEPPRGAVLHNVHAAKEEVGHCKAEHAAQVIGSMLLDAARPARGMGYAYPWAGDGLAPVDLDPGSGPLGEVLGIVHDAYVVALSTEGLVLVDAHAAHERILLEALRSSRLQRLLLHPPAVANLDPRERAVFQDAREALAAMGWEITDLDGGSVAILAVPEPLGGSMPVDALRAALAAFHEGGDAVEERLADMACRAAWRGGDFLDHQTATRLLRTMETTPSSAVCNHGRPTCVRMPKEAMAKLFGR